LQGSCGISAKSLLVWVKWFDCLFVVTCRIHGSFGTVVSWYGNK
jgi:hypothetical protein